MSVTAEGFKALSNQEKGKVIASWLYSNDNWEVNEDSWERISKQILEFGQYAQTWKESDAASMECDTAQFQLWMRSFDCKRFFETSSNTGKKAPHRKAIEALMEKFSQKSQKEEGKKGEPA